MGLRAGLRVSGSPAPPAGTKNDIKGGHSARHPGLCAFDLGRLNESSHHSDYIEILNMVLLNFE